MFPMKKSESVYSIIPIKLRLGCGAAPSPVNLTAADLKIHHILYTHNILFGEKFPKIISCMDLDGSSHGCELTP